ncbi:hypothetical protein J7T55_004866 [Diaporthe amygdali]|uniref:uncharacterized protein n=1 Tax=Phomopsis amygdali TaxID=1214568 RepID=UPI0022FE314A|nr:uncharacterized protein J7T55_004866 [Diaporthe amygdali]KAJ0114622.1 hypothetical protein J7T55_004866 [Diaporthe amygdali]
MLISRFLCLMAAPLVARAADTSSHRVTSVFIDTVSGYDELSTCAEEVLSTIVRAQYSGCGDKGAVTSYTCFCTDSSSEMSSMITNAVSLSCDSSVVSAQASSAIDVFDAYCAIGVPDDLVETTTTGGTYHLIGARAAECKRSCTDPRNDSFHSKRNRNCNASGHGVDNCGIGDFSDFGHRFFFFNFNVHAQHVNEPLEGPGLLWCRRRRRHLQQRSEKRQQLESTSQATGMGSSRPEFKWPTRIAGTQELPTQYHSHEMPAQEFITSPTSSDFHISPLPVTPAYQQQQSVYQVQSEKHPHQHHEYYKPSKEAHQQQEPQELPASSELSIENRHELEGSLSPQTPSARFSYQPYEK